jgi:SAM-dependent methyltransferase
VVRLAESGVFAGTVLDAGCGTGDNGLHIAALGLRVVGVDVAETAVAIAQQKALATGANADFVVGDAFHLDRLGQTFDTVLDCALFHALEGDERDRYVASLASVTAPGATLHLICFGDADVPHPVTEDELRAAFAPGTGWTIASVRPDTLITRFAPEGVPAWQALALRA